MDDEPLEGDIGPSAPVREDAPDRSDASAPGPEPGGPPLPRPADPDERRAAVAAEIRRLEAERERRRRRTNALAGRAAFWLLALFLAFLAYDSAVTAHEARQRGADWIYPPAVNAVLCILGVLLLLGFALWRRRARSR
ncbi:hypothetical protein [Actinomadura rupiterrae]|uniref:hypothetical protein n=1 Tax=Actinomadura rupiterrae TaxID=559627 RepID=UPI0020A473BF|nr:hypothetical protein [Actinomadura rupiterrae]MCP2337113.1 membrane-bound ClpP family serine protease [Actinomadura rupiterrae]